MEICWQKHYFKKAEKSLKKVIEQDTQSSKCFSKIELIFYKQWSLLEAEVYYRKVNFFDDKNKVDLNIGVSINFLNSF